MAPGFLKVTQEETDRMIRMINELLSLSRMDSGTTRVDMELVNINEMFNYVLDRFDMILKKDDNPAKYYTIKREFTKRDLWVEIDTDKFTQVLDNIMNNAIKYSPDGGVVILPSRQGAVTGPRWDGPRFGNFKRSCSDARRSYLG